MAVGDETQQGDNSCEPSVTDSTSVESRFLAERSRSTPQREVAIHFIAVVTMSLQPSNHAMERTVGLRSFVV